MRPWYKGFHGRIEGSQSSDGEYTSYGCIQESNGMLKITELPIRKWTDKYLKFLNSVAEHNVEAKDPFIKGYKKYGDDTSPIDIRVKLSGKQLREAKQEGLEKNFKLEKKLKTSNMVLFQNDNSLKLYRTPQEILVEFYKIGMEQYQTRLNNLRNKTAAEVLKLKSELDFDKRYREGNIILSNDHMQKNVDLLEYIKHQGFEDNPENLASLKLVSLTKESETALKKELAKMEEELNKVVNKAAATVWIEDLQVLENELLKDKFFRLTD